MAQNIKFYICPDCRQHFESTTQFTKCEKCNKSLMTNDEFLKYRIDKNKNKQYEEKKSNTVFTIICTIIAIIVLIFLVSIFTTPKKTNSRTCKRCDKTFTDSDNTWSIAYSGFCEKCHDDFEFIQDVQDELKNY